MKKDINIIVVLIILNLILKSICLGDYNIDLDEPFSLYHANGDLKYLLELLKWENNPPLFFIILHFWIKIFGIGVISARFLPMIFSSLVVIFIYKTGKKYVNQVAAIGASLLYTFSNQNIMEAHDARVYSLFVLLTCASMYFYLSMIDSGKKHKYLIALTITNILLIYSHYLAFFVILTQVIFTLVITQVRKKIFRQYLISFGIMLLAYLPYLYIFLIRLTTTLHDGLSAEKSKLYHLYFLLEAFCNYHPTIAVLFLIILATFAVFLFVKRQTLSVQQIIIIGWFVIPYVLMFLISYKLPMTIPRYMIFITPGLFLTVMMAVSYLGSKVKFIAIGLSLVCVCLMAITTDLNYSLGFQSKKAVGIIRTLKSDSTRVYIFPRWIEIVFTYHYNLDIFKHFGTYQEYLNKDNIYALSQPNDIDTSRLKNVKDVLLLIGWGADIQDKDNLIAKTLIQKIGPMDTVAILRSYSIFHFGENKIKKQLARKD